MVNESYDSFESTHHHQGLVVLVSLVTGTGLTTHEYNRQLVRVERLVSTLDDS